VEAVLLSDSETCRLDPSVADQLNFAQAANRFHVAKAVA
jgi:hypothetical protein